VRGTQPSVTFTFTLSVAMTPFIIEIACCVDVGRGGRETGTPGETRDAGEEEA